MEKFIIEFVGPYAILGFITLFVWFILIMRTRTKIFKLLKMGNSTLSAEDLGKIARIVSSLSHKDSVQKAFGWSIRAKYDAEENNEIRFQITSRFFGDRFKESLINELRLVKSAKQLQDLQEKIKFKTYESFYRKFFSAEEKKLEDRLAGEEYVLNIDIVK